MVDDEKAETNLQKLLTLRLLEPTELPSFRVKIPDVEIEFHSSDVKEVHKRFDEVMAYLKEVMNGKNKDNKRR